MRLDIIAAVVASAEVSMFLSAIIFVSTTTLATYNRFGDDRWCNVSPHERTIDCVFYTYNECIDLQDGRDYCIKNGGWADVD